MKKSLAFLLVFTLLMGMFGIQAAAAVEGINPDLPSVDLSKLGSANIPAAGTGSCWTYEKNYQKLTIRDSDVIIFQTGDAAFNGSIQISSGVTSVTFDNITVEAQWFDSAFSTTHNDLAITLKGNSKLTYTSNFGAMTALNASGSELTIKDGGTLVCTGGNNTHSGSGAAGVIAKSISVENGKIIAQGGKGTQSPENDGVAFNVGSNPDSVEELQAVLSEGSEPAKREHLIDLAANQKVFNSYKLAKSEQEEFEPNTTPYAYLEYKPASGGGGDKDDDDDKDTSKSTTSTTVRRYREPTVLPISLKRNFDETTLTAGKEYNFSVFGPEKHIASYVYVSGGTIASRSGHNFTVVPSETADVVKITITASGFNEITLEYAIAGGFGESLFEPVP